MNAQQTAVTVAPGLSALAVTWLGILETGLSVVLLGLSIAFLLWRWHKAITKQDNKE